MEWRGIVPFGSPKVRNVICTAAVIAVMTATAGTAVAAPAASPSRPVVSKLSATAGPLAGGTRVTVTGKNFTKVSKIDFGTTAGGALKVLSSTKLEVTAPKHTAGVVNVEVVAKAGTSAAVSADRFTYVSPPSVSKLSAQAGPLSGGTRVTVAGKNFTKVAVVDFGTAAGTSLKVVSSTELRVTAPKHAAGTVNVKVATTYGTSSAVTADRFSYIAPPVITSVYPATGSIDGGWTTLTVTNCQAQEKVTFGGKPATAYGANVECQFSVQAPPEPAGTVSVQVTTAYGASASGKGDQYTYGPPPTVTSVSPDSGPSAGGTTITITGTGFSDVQYVQVGADNFVPPSSFTVDSSTRITAVTPAGTGPQDVQVDAEYGLNRTSTADKFSYISPPKESLTWAGPTRVNGTGNGYLSDPACLSATNCFAIDGAGDKVTWNGSTWSGPAPAVSGSPGQGGQGGTSCSTSSFCMVVGFNGAWAYSGGTWSHTDLDDDYYWQSVSCPSTTFCVAADGNGHVSTYSKGTWSAPDQLDATGQLSVSCVSSSFCIVGAGSGKAYTWNGTKWSAPVTVSAWAITVDCVSTSWCVAVDQETEVYHYNGAQWTDTGTTDQDPANNNPSRLVCTSTTFCMAVDATGDVVGYNGATWTSYGTPITSPEADLNFIYWPDLACSGETCVETVSGPNSFADSFTGGTWGPAKSLDGSGELDVVSCAPSAGASGGSFCAAVGASLDALTETDGSWSGAVPLAGALDPSTVSCTSAQFCLAADPNALFWQYSGSAWASVAAPSGLADGTMAVSCASATLCGLADSEGGLTTYNGSAWTALADTTGNWSTISCPATSFCAAGDFNNGDVALFDGASWSAPTVLDSTGIEALSCASATFCIATSENADVYEFNGSTWTPMTTNTDASFTSVSCPSSTFCAAVDYTGSVYTWNGAQWSSPDAVTSDDVSPMISCANSAYCVITDGTGSVYTGT
jgi:uncharacterized Fe-S cluster protein YjdI